MAQLINQFAQTAVQGQLWNQSGGGNPNIVTCKIDPNSTTTTFDAGTVVKLSAANVDSGQNMVFYIDLCTTADAPYGVITFNSKKNSWAPTDTQNFPEIAFRDSFIFLTAADTITYGDLVMISSNDGTTNTITTWTSGNFVLGIAMEAGIAGDLLGVQLLTPLTNETLTFNNVQLGGSISSSGLTYVAGGGTVDITGLGVYVTSSASSMTFNFPDSPTDGQWLFINCVNTISSVTLNPGTGQTILSPIGSTSGTQGFWWIYSAANLTWYRMPSTGI